MGLGDAYRGRVVGSCQKIQAPDLIVPAPLIDLQRLLVCEPVGPDTPDATIKKLVSHGSNSQASFGLRAHAVPSSREGSCSRTV